MRTYVPLVWLLANLLHPFIMGLYFNEGFFSLTETDWAGILQVVVYSFIFSLPSLLLGWLAGYIIYQIPAPVYIRFICWLTAAPLIALCNFLLLFLVLSSSFHFFELEIAVPAMLSVLMASLFCGKIFFRQYQTHKTKENEQGEIV